MKIKWLGHSSFLITSDSGIRIITDPYNVGGQIYYGRIKEPADIVTISHEHLDHNNAAAVPGSPQIVRGTTEAKGIKFQGIPTCHDNSGGSQRGANTVLCFEVDGINICHAGDLGHLLSAGQVARIGRTDVLFIPVGGYYTIDARTAGRVADQLKPKVIIPMHYKTDKLDFPVTGVDEFTRGKENVLRPDSSEVELTAAKLPAETRIIVLKAAN